MPELRDLDNIGAAIRIAISLIVVATIAAIAGIAAVGWWAWHVF